MKIGLIRLLQLVVGFALTLLVCSCGGSGTTADAVFGSAGTLAFQKEVVADGSGIDFSDPNSILRVIAPGGAIASGQKIKIEIWSAQRELVKLKNFSQSLVAADLIVAPGALGENVISLEMSGSSTPGPRVILSAFGAGGKLIPLPEAEGAALPRYRGRLSADLISYLTGVSKTSMNPVRIQIVVQSLMLPEFKVEAPSIQSELKTVFKRPADSRKPYASKKRVAVLVAGMLELAPNSAQIDYLKNKRTKEDSSSELSYAYDEISFFTYDWTSPVPDSAAGIKQILDENYGDKDANEIDIYAHGEGGLVCRWATEKLGIAATKKLFLLGTPQGGYIPAVTSALLLNLAPVAGVGNVPSLSKLVAGIIALDTQSPVIKGLSESSPVSGVKYHFISGTKPSWPIANLDFSQSINVLYFAAYGRLDSGNDGLVSVKSSVLAPTIPNPIKLVANQGHADLAKDMGVVFNPIGSTDLIPGLNRTIDSLSSETAFETVLASESITLKVIAKDKDGDLLDENLLFSSTGASRNPPLQWTASDPTVVFVTPSRVKFDVDIRGLKAGDSTVTVKDPVSGKSFAFSIKVVDSTVLVLPNKPDLQLNEVVTFSATPIQGEFPTNRTISWAVKEGRLRKKGTAGAGSTSFESTSETEVEYVAPNKSIADRISMMVSDDQLNRIVGRGATDINIGTPFKITPNSSVVPSSGYQKFTVEALGSSTLPTGGSYQWSVAGGGNLSDLTTSTPSVDYTAPSGQADPVVSVKILDSTGTQVGSATTSIKVRPGNFRFTASNINPFVTNEIVNGDYNGPLVTIGQGIVGSVYRIGLIFGVTEGPGVTPDTAAWIVQIALSQGSRLQVGQSFLLGPVNRPGVFYASSVLAPSGGTMKILTATLNADSTHTYTYSISLDAFTSIGGSEANVITGTGTFTLAY